MYGLLSALASAVLFGAATPAAKRLLLDLTAFQLAGLLYLGAAIGIAPGALWQRGDRPPLDAMNRRRLAGAVLFGGILGPVLLLLGLRSALAGSVSLLLNFEIAALVFDREINDGLARAFLADIEQAREFTRADLANAPFLARLGQAGARLMSPLL